MTMHMGEHRRLLLGPLSDEDLRQIAERVAWEVGQRPPPDPNSFLSSPRYELTPEDEERLEALFAELESTGEADSFRAQKVAPPGPYELDAVATALDAEERRRMAELALRDAIARAREDRARLAEVERAATRLCRELRGLGEPPERVLRVAKLVIEDQIGTTNDAIAEHAIRSCITSYYSGS
jgi:hypothetical protein